MMYTHPSRQTSQTELDPTGGEYDQKSSEVSTNHNICAVLADSLLLGMMSTSSVPYLEAVLYC